MCLITISWVIWKGRGNAAENSERPENLFWRLFMIRQNPVCHAFLHSTPSSIHRCKWCPFQVKHLPRFSCFKAYLKCIVITGGPRWGDCWFACYTIGFLGGDNFQVIREYNGRVVGQHNNASMTMVRPRLQLLPKQTFLIFATHDPQCRLGIFL